MKPIKIEPKDVYIVFEISASQLESVVDYIEHMNQFDSRVFIENSPVVADVAEFLKVSQEVLKHPLVERELSHGA